MKMRGFLGMLGVVACGGENAEPVEETPEVPERCQHVFLDKLDADWIGMKGQTPDPKTRLRVFKDGQEGYGAYLVNGFFKKITLKGETRESDVQFTEVPSEAQAKRIAKGEATLVRMYVTPKLKDCALKTVIGTVDHKDKERISPVGFDFVAFPELEVTFTFEPANRTLFVGEAAKDRAVADRQMAQQGHASPEHEFGTIPVGLFSAAAEDGPEGCTFDMDLYFDGQSLPDRAAVSAGEVTDGFRHWFVVWDAPYSGNHHFEMYRFRTCDGTRERIDIADLEAILQ
jgi:hypothetical protein